MTINCFMLFLTEIPNRKPSSSTLSATLWLKPEITTKVLKMKKTALALLFTSSFVYADSSTELGFSLITPGGINFVAKGEVANIPLQIALGLAVRGTYGIEGGYNFYRNKDSWFRSAQIIAGKSHIGSYSNEPSRDWNYVGVSTTFQSGHFFIEPGLTVGKGDFSNPQFSLQIGGLWGL